MLTDDPSSGDPEIQESYRYDEYGEAYVYSPSGTARSASDYEQDYLYTGRRWDPELEMYYYRARYYEATLNFFVSRDPKRADVALNNYRYVDALPLSNVDPLGLAGESPCRPWGNGSPHKWCQEKMGKAGIRCYYVADKGCTETRQQCGTRR